MCPSFNWDTICCLCNHLIFIKCLNTGLKLVHKLAVYLYGSLMYTFIPGYSCKKIWAIKKYSGPTYSTFCNFLASIKSKKKKIGWLSVPLIKLYSCLRIHKKRLDKLLIDESNPSSWLLWLKIKLVIFRIWSPAYPVCTHSPLKVVTWDFILFLSIFVCLLTDPHGTIFIISIIDWLTHHSATIH